MKKPPKLLRLTPAGPNQDQEEQALGFPTPANHPEATLSPLTILRRPAYQYPLAGMPNVPAGTWQESSAGAPATPPAATLSPLTIFRGHAYRHPLAGIPKIPAGTSREKSSGTPAVTLSPVTKLRRPAYQYPLAGILGIPARISPETNAGAAQRKAPLGLPTLVDPTLL